MSNRLPEYYGDYGTYDDAYAYGGSLRARVIPSSYKRHGYISDYDVLPPSYRRDGYISDYDIMPSSYNRKGYISDYDRMPRVRAPKYIDTYDYEYDRPYPSRVLSTNNLRFSDHEAVWLSDS